MDNEFIGTIFIVNFICINKPELYVKPFKFITQTYKIK